MNVEFVRGGSGAGMGGGIGSILYSDRWMAPAPGPVEYVEYFTYNAVGHTVATTDDSGDVFSANQYDAFGNVVSSSGTSDNNRLANTKERDASLGLDNHGFRYYDPSTGRYLTRDPLGYADGMNVYLSVGNNPINFIDPIGLEAQPVVTSPFSQYGFCATCHGSANGDWVNVASGLDMREIGQTQFTAMAIASSTSARLSDDVAGIADAGVDFVGQAAAGYSETQVPTTKEYSNPHTSAGVWGRRLGRAVGAVQGAFETAGGSIAAVGGTTVAVLSGGTLALPGLAVAAGGTALTTHGYSVMDRYAKLDPVYMQEQSPEGTLMPGNKGTYGQLKAQKKLYGETEALDMDHRPSYAAQKKALEDSLGRKLTDAEAEALKNNTPAVATPRTAHQQKSRTYGGRNTQEQIAEDAEDLERARSLDNQAMGD